MSQLDENIKLWLKKYAGLLTEEEKERFSNPNRNHELENIDFENLDGPDEKIEQLLRQTGDLYSIQEYMKVVRDKLPEDLQLLLIEPRGYYIEHLFKYGITPSEKVQLAAVTTSPHSIVNILGNGIIPSERVQLAAVTKDPSTIQPIINYGIKPSEKIRSIGKDYLPERQP